MPHKHKRSKQDHSRNFDLPPSTTAKPLSIAPGRASGQRLLKPKASRSRKAVRANDDTPRNFARLMQFQAGKRLPSGLDEGTSISKKRKRDHVQTASSKSVKGSNKGSSPPIRGQTHQFENSERMPSTEDPAPSKPQENLHSIPTLLPGEKLSEFSSRVDRALPLTGFQSKGPNLGKTKLTKHDRRLQRLQSQWRIEEQRRREKAEALLDEQEDEKEEADLLWYDVKVAAAKKKRKTRTQDEDPWASIAVKRKGTGQRNLQDIVEEPPKLGRVTARFKGSEDA